MLNEIEQKDLENRLLTLHEEYGKKIDEFERLHWTIYHIRQEINVIMEKLGMNKNENTGQ
jgi:hypothetical protein